MSTKLASTSPQDIKCVAVGDGAVGKTCMLISYSQNRFPEDYIPTVFDNYSAKLLHEGEYVNLHLWDTAGQEAYQSLRHVSYPGTDVFLVVFSVVSRNSFNNAINLWFEDIQETAPGVPIVFVGAKSDLRLDEEAQEKCRKMGKPMVTTAEATKAAKKLGAAAYVECSAMTQEGLHNVFNTAVSAAMGGDKESEQHCACTIM